MPHYDASVADQITYYLSAKGQRLWAWAKGPGRQRATWLSLAAIHQLRRNLTSRRLWSFPHLVVVFWVLILLWGERWVFDSKVASCDWDHWEDWPKGANPHHLVFIADPQIIDPHSYPGRPWVLSELTMIITDNYLLRGYKSLQRRLTPDTVMLLGDLFDGGREWKTHRGEFVDPRWGKQRSRDEAKWVDTWHRKYGEEYWLREYKRFGNIFFDHWGDGGDAPGAWQRGRKLIASLPGNHDLGFGAQVQVPVRDRFSAHFGDLNRVDVIGNHTFVSVDTLSLSAASSDFAGTHDLSPIYGPVNRFLKGVQASKRRAVKAELSAWHDGAESLKYPHDVEELELSTDPEGFPPTDPGADAVEFPTILLTHVPLYREPGTPCGPQREHWPPTKPAKGETGPTIPDHRNAISVSGGYQYQNVLEESDSVKLVKDVGNVVQVFSGDDHDYCQLVHSESQGNVPEITVKSMSMAMGVPTPGFLMVSLYNPVDEDGNRIPGAPETTLQTHLCLLPNQIHTYIKYVAFIILSLVVLILRAVLVPILGLSPFALEKNDIPEFKYSNTLPISTKDKVEPPDLRSPTLGSSSTSMWHGAGNSTLSSNGRWQPAQKGKRRWTNGPRINLDEAFYDPRQTEVGSSKTLGVVGKEIWTTVWRVAWMTVLFWIYLAREK